jgi:O-antigen ligase
MGLLMARLPLVWAGGLVGGTAVLLLTVINPMVGLFAALLAAPWGALENIVRGPSPLDSGQLLLLFTLAVWLGRGLAYRRIFIPRTFLNVPLAIFIFVSALSLLNAPSLSFGFREVLKWVEVTAVMLLVVDLSMTRQPYSVNRPQIRDHRLRFTFYVLTILLLAGLSQALIGIWQFGLRGDGPEHFLVLGRFYRAYGTFEQPNPYAGFMNLTALLAAGAFLGAVAALWRQVAGGKWQVAGGKWQVAGGKWQVAGGRWQVAGGRWQVAGKKAPTPLLPCSPAPLLAWSLFIGVTAVLCTLAVLFSWSRGAWLSLAVGGAVMALFWPKKFWHGVALLLMAGFIFWGGVQTGLVPASVTERITSFSEDLRFGDVRGVDINDANYAVLERLAHWQSALEMAREHIWLGVGFGNYEPAYAEYALINWPYPLGHAHNYYLNTLAETGVWGLVVYGLWWAAVFFQTIRQLRQVDWPVRGIALGLLGAWTAVTVHHLVDKLYVNNIYIHLGVMLGLLQLLEYERQQNSTKEALEMPPTIR